MSPLPQLTDVDEKEMLMDGFQRRLVLTIVLVSALFGAAAPGSSDADLAARIEGAKTREDHAALADFYEKEAASARAKAELHARMETSYRKLGGGAVEKLHLDRHCRSLAEAARRLAEENEAMAKAHRSIAESIR